MSLIAVGGMITLGLVLASAVWASRESDLAALDRQRQLVNGRLDSQIQSVAYELGLMADGYASTINSVSSSGEIDAFDSMAFGDIMTSVFKYDEAFVVWSNGEMAIKRDSETASRYEWIRPLVMPMLQRTVQAMTLGARDDGDTKKSESVELMRLQGRPSIAGIIPIHNVDRSTQGRPLFLIAYRYLDGPALDALSRDQGLNGVRFARSSDPEANEVTFQIEATATNEPIGFIIWTPDLPGSKVVVSMIPALTISALIISILLGGLVFLLRKTLADLQDSEQKARHQSLHDILTDLPNRALFAQRLEDTIAQQQTGAPPAIVALIDLDKFKAVNDTLGHAAGDELIQSVASRVMLLVGAEDTLARLGGDEFALLLPHNPERSASHLELCNQIVDEISQPFSLQGGRASAHIGCSIGITIISTSSQTASEVLHAADVALYEAKSSGRGRCVEYADNMDTSAKLREGLKGDLRAFLDGVDTIRDERFNQTAAVPAFGLEVFYQTIHRAGDTDRISGAEALVRWRHETLGLLTPDKFISLAEDSGLIHRLGKFVLTKACTAAACWPNSARLSVNVSPTQLRILGFADEVMQILERSGLPPFRLELEVTETALMGGDEAIVKTALAHLRERGVQIALDDFGTGYSSLSHLIQFGIDRLKIDRSFVRLLGTRADGAAIVSAVVALSRSLGLATTAEGVETPGQRDFLAAAGCTDLQGFLFSRPQPEPDMTSGIDSNAMAGETLRAANQIASTAVRDLM
ncbi:diguanylate cyclase (GGDEF)-like protein [Devosia sp. UYZn731]|uniref:putative bifunctional diguanylate cyclase/phosphodiesterase n=1 Tax=Devosia sp. UYZn731 TaxID=3156345 RepID=UPI0033957AD7